MTPSIAWLALAPAILLLTACGSDPAEPVSQEMMVDISELPAPAVTRLQNPGPTHILFVGNSYLYYGDSVHNHVRRMVVAAGLHERSDMAYKSATIGGAALSDHNIDHLIDPVNLRVDAPFDVVILQGLSSAALSEAGRRRFSDSAADYALKVADAGGDTVLYMTHAYVEPHRRYSPDMIEHVATLYIETANDISALVIPVGLAFEEAYRRRPDLALHTAFDGSHPNLAGTYLASATVFASLYGVSPIENRYDYFGAIDADTALFLQTVAHDTVREFHGRALTQG